ncbi:alpha/beta hydrolase [Celeribacter halophilus]|uniref:alpha/beta hydrolase n=1 Tax=Celeribacter halophilus TaxID=576117 RepID=UPI003A91C55E
MSLTRREMVLGASALTLSVSGCASPRLNLPQEVPDISGQKQENILVVTNRQVSPDPTLGFEELRSDTPFYRNYRISIPPERKPGEYSFPRKPLDADTQFFVTDSEAFDTEQAFIDRVNARVSALPKGERSVVVFVHGFNVSYPGAVFRTAQITTDFELEQPMVLFSWPSAGRISRYAYDRDSVLYARTALANTLKLLARSRAENVLVLAHSMGGLLAMEAIKRLALEGDRRTLSRLEGVALSQPDIDVDLFRRQVSDLEPYNIDLAVFGSRRDQALKISSVLTGGHPRVGAAENIEDLRKLGVTVIDTTGAPMGDPLGHSSLMQSPALLAMIASGTLLSEIVEGAPGQDILVEGLTLTGSAALAIAYLPYTISGE